MANSDNLDPVQGSVPCGPSLGGRAARAEIARFDALAPRWWDPSGPMAPLHAMNSTRTGWIAERLPGATSLLDVGCGAGLASETLARCGHSVTAIDAAAQAIETARAHAMAGGVRIDYRVATTGDLMQEPARFGAVTALEVIEHVPDPAGFMADLATLLSPGGTLFMSTINRTAKSLVVAKWGAEYLLRLLPAGTHDWRRFVTPAELARLGRAAGLRMTANAGMSFNPLRQTWSISRDLSVNYIAAFAR